MNRISLFIFPYTQFNLFFDSYFARARLFERVGRRNSEDNGKSADSVYLPSENENENENESVESLQREARGTLWRKEFDDRWKNSYASVAIEIYRVRKILESKRQLRIGRDQHYLIL